MLEAEVHDGMFGEGEEFCGVRPVGEDNWLGLVEARHVEAEHAPEEVVAVGGFGADGAEDCIEGGR